MERLLVGTGGKDGSGLIPLLSIFVQRVAAATGRFMTTHHCCVIK